MRLGLVAALAASLLGSAAAYAGEIEVQLGLGMNESAHSAFILSGTGGSTTYWPTWEGRSFANPLYYNVAVIYWPSSLQDWGFGLELNHAKAYADLTDPGMSDFDHLEFSDGLNLLTVNAFRKWDWNQARAYVGAGAGLSIPHVEVLTNGGASAHPNSTTWNYQIGGAAVQVLAGVSYEVVPNWRLFGEAKVSYAMNKVALTGGGTAETNLVSTHLRAGISVAFDDGTGW